MRLRIPHSGMLAGSSHRALGSLLDSSPVLFVLASIPILVMLACGSSEDSSETADAEPKAAHDLVITLGDIDPDLPADRVRQLQPLADHLAERLADHGYGRGSVLIARDIDEMAVLLQEGRVDVYLDTIFPSLSVRDSADTEIILRRAVKGVLDYWSVFITQRVGGVGSLDELGGKVLAFQEAYSTSGYFLPAGVLRQRGIELVPVGGPDAAVQEHQTGYVFSRDEENTLALVLDGTVSLGAISSQDYEELTPSIKEQLTVVDRTIAVPRTLVSIRSNLDEAVVEELRSILLELRGESLSDEEGAWTWSFSTLSEQSEQAIVAVGEMIGSTEGE